MPKTFRVLENIQGCSTHGCIDGVPVEAEVQIQIEVGDNRFPIDSHVGGRGEVRILDVLDLLDERLLWITSRARIPLQCPLIHHDDECKTGVALRLCHDQLCHGILKIPRAIPVHDHTVDSAADHVLDLAMDLCGIVGLVADVHRARSTKPKHEMGVDLRGGAWIQKRVDIQFADT